jgi:putative transposase
MPRRARLSVPGIPWHIIQRGNNRSACFYADEDYQLYLEYLTEFSEKFGCAVHAYVLMTNHVHLLLTPEREESAALLMKHLGQRYVQYVNRTYRRSGTLWEGRFRSCLAQAEDYVLACYRYIELNPVRADMVRHPREYRWSSYRTNAEGRRNELIQPHEMYKRLGRSTEARHEAYRGLFKAHMDDAMMDNIRAATNGNYVLGTTRFQEEIGQMLGRRVTKGRAGRPVKAAVDDE